MAWEAQVLDVERAAETLVSWYRNPWSGRHALTVPYVFSNKHQLMHPDFLFWHDDGDGEYVMDIVDPTGSTSPTPRRSGQRCRATPTITLTGSAATSRSLR